MSKPAKLTPMMEQYFEIKRTCPDAILFYRLGDFYEMFYEDALTAAKVLEITLTSRNKNDDNPIPMCGVPYHAANDYIKKLIDAGYKIAICEQLEDPKSVKGMVKRGIVRTITPGTYVDDQVGDRKENNFLAAIYPLTDHDFGLCYIDIATGESYLTCCGDTEMLWNEIQSVHPSEIIIPTFLKEKIYQFKTVESITFTEHALPESKIVYPTSLIEELTSNEAPIYEYLLSYLNRLQMESFAHLKPVQRYAIDQAMQLNHYTKIQLELTRSLRTHKRKGSLLSYIDQTQTAMGGRLLARWLDKPLINQQKIEARHKKVAAFLSAYFERMDLVNSLKNIYDLERLISKISLGYANPKDIDHLYQSLCEVRTINQILDSMNQFDSSVSFQLLNDFSELINLISSVLIDNPPLSSSEGNLIRSGVHETLDQYRDALEHGEDWLAQLQVDERERTGLKTLKVGFNKVFGYYIEISRVQAAELDDPRYIRKQTLANSERFFTDELKEIEQTILNAKEKSTALEYQLFVELREQILNYIEPLQQLAMQVAELDVLSAFASLADQEDYVQPQIVSQPKDVEIIQSRHPVVEKLIKKTNFVPNDFSSTSENYLHILTGPNMSGKSTYMRQIAYCFILCQIGSFVPATSAKLPIIDKIFTRIGSADDTTLGQSTFMVEMMETQVALKEATANSLLLFDELGRGTATYDGIALAEGIIRYIAQKIQCLTIFSTHYHELTRLDSDLPAVRNIHVGSEELNGELVFLHKVLEGPSDRSYGIHVAQIAGLPKQVIRQSAEILEALESQAKYLPNVRETIQEKKEIQTTALSSEIINKIKALDVNQLTPVDALNLLVELQRDVNES